MAITSEQREIRRRYIGSSDAAAICGLDPWQTAADIYQSKVAELFDAPNDAMQTGNRLEPVVLDWAEERLGVKLLRNVLRIAEPTRCANHDALIEGRRQGVEAKTTAIEGPGNIDEWGDEGTDQVPEHVLIQTHHQMLVSELELVWVPVLIGTRGFRMYRVERNEAVIKAVAEREDEFWHSHIQPHVPPPSSVPSLEILKRIRRTPNKTVSIPDSIVSAWLEAKAESKAAQEREDTAKAVVIASLGDAEAGECSSGLVTYFEQQSRRVNADALRINHPDIAESVAKVTACRVLREPKQRTKKGA